MFPSSANVLPGLISGQIDMPADMAGYFDR
jgi:hypothetical protein